MSFNSRNPPDRRTFIGGSDAWIIMGDDEAALVRLWREKARRGRAREPLEQPDRPARHRDGTSQPALVLMPEDAREAAGHGVRARRSKSGAISFDIVKGEPGHAAIQP